MSTASKQMIPDLSQVQTTTLGSFLFEGFMVPSIQSIIPATRIWGPALTVRLPGTDGSALVEALSVAASGDVIVIDRCGDLRHACFGAIAATAALKRGVAGVVIDGFVTDLAALLDIGLPVWCRGRSPITTRSRGIAGHVGAVINCGGTMVGPGDIILADENGVVVLDPRMAGEHAAAALRLQQEQRDVLHALNAGKTLLEITRARPGSGENRSISGKTS